MCFHRDLSFTIETLIGDINFNYEVAAIAIDLHSPLSWLKSTECNSCPKDTPNPTIKSIRVIHSHILYIDIQYNIIEFKLFK